MDTNGAGDAFVGGFLAALAKGKDMEVRGIEHGDFNGIFMGFYWDFHGI